MLKKSLVAKRYTGFLCFVEKNFALLHTGRHVFEAITDISSDAESREEQNGASLFLIEAMTAKLWPIF